MRLPFSVSAALLLAPLAPVLALRHTSGMQVGPIETSLRLNTDLLGKNGSNGWGTFDQQLDHSDPGKGTFEQRFVLCTPLPTVALKLTIPVEDSGMELNSGRARARPSFLLPPVNSQAQ